MKKLLIGMILSACIIAPAQAAIQDGDGITCRNHAIKHQFDKMNGYPHGRPGYVVDHWCPLAAGGLDDVTNMVYQTIQESHAKDKIELTKEGIAKYCNEKNSTTVRKVFNCKSKAK